MTAPASTSPPSRFVRLARICNRHRWRTFGAWLLALVVIQVIASSVGVKEISSFRLPGTESQRAYDLLAEHFPAAKGDTDQLVYRARTGTLADAGQPGADRGLAQAGGAQNRTSPSVASPFGPGGRLTGGRAHRRRHAELQGEHERHHAGRPRDDREGRVHRPQPAAAGRARRPGRRGRALQQQPGPVGGHRHLRRRDRPAVTFGSLVAAGLPLVATLLALGCALGVITLISHLVDTPDFATQLAIADRAGRRHRLLAVRGHALPRRRSGRGAIATTAIEKAIDTAGRTVMFAAITVVIALLGLLLLGLSFMHGVALGAAATVLAVMFSALTIIPALIGGSGPFMDGVLREFDRRGGFRFWGTQRRIHIPGEAWRARRAAKRERKRAEGSGWAALVGVGAAPPVAGRRSSRSWCCSRWRSRR